MASPFYLRTRARTRKQPPIEISTPTSTSMSLSAFRHPFTRAPLLNQGKTLITEEQDMKALRNRAKEEEDSKDRYSIEALFRRVADTELPTPLNARNGEYISRIASETVENMHARVQKNTAAIVAEVSTFLDENGMHADAEHVRGFLARTQNLGVTHLLARTYAEKVARPLFNEEEIDTQTLDVTKFPIECISIAYMDEFISFLKEWSRIPHEPKRTTATTTTTTTEEKKKTEKEKGEEEAEESSLNTLIEILEDFKLIFKGVNAWELQKKKQEVTRKRLSSIQLTIELKQTRKRQDTHIENMYADDVDRYELQKEKVWQVLVLESEASQRYQYGGKWDPLTVDALSVLFGHAWVRAREDKGILSFENQNVASEPLVTELESNAAARESTLLLHMLYYRKELVAKMKHTQSKYTSRISSHKQSEADMFLEPLVDIVARTMSSLLLQWKDVPESDDKARIVGEGLLTHLDKWSHVIERICDICTIDASAALSVGQTILHTLIQRFTILIQLAEIFYQDAMGAGSSGGDGGSFPSGVEFGPLLHRIVGSRLFTTTIVTAAGGLALWFGVDPIQSMRSVAMFHAFFEVIGTPGVYLMRQALYAVAAQVVHVIAHSERRIFWGAFTIGLGLTAAQLLQLTPVVGDPLAVITLNGGIMRLPMQGAALMLHIGAQINTQRAISSICAGAYRLLSLGFRSSEDDMRNRNRAVWLLATGIARFAVADGNVRYMRGFSDSVMETLIEFRQISLGLTGILDKIDQGTQIWAGLEKAGIVNAIQRVSDLGTTILPELLEHAYNITPEMAAWQTVLDMFFTWTFVEYFDDWIGELYRKADEIDARGAEPLSARIFVHLVYLQYVRTIPVIRGYQEFSKYMDALENSEALLLSVKSTAMVKGVQQSGTEALKEEIGAMPTMTPEEQFTEMERIVTDVREKLEPLLAEAKNGLNNELLTKALKLTKDKGYSQLFGVRGQRGIGGITGGISVATDETTNKQNYHVITLKLAKLIRAHQEDSITTRALAGVDTLETSLQTGRREESREKTYSKNDFHMSFRENIVVKRSRADVEPEEARTITTGRLVVISALAIGVFTGVAQYYTTDTVGILSTLVSTATYTFGAWLS